MAGSDSTQQSLRKVLGVLKDSTTVGLAKVNSDYKDLDIAIVKATNHVEEMTKEKHIRTIFEAVSATRPRADVAYCINALARRLAKTHNWAVALKTLIVIHRALREVDPTFREELINYTRSRGHMLNLSHFKDDSSPSAWDYSAWVRTYALYLEERLECVRVLKYDVETERSRLPELETAELLEQLPALQQVLFRLFACQPEGAAMYNVIIIYALSFVSGESIKLYAAINGGILNLVDKFFEMQRHDALRALEIYRKAGQQAERLSEFYEVCKGLEFGRGKAFLKIEQPPASFIAAMEEYVKDAPRALVVHRDLVDKEIKVHAQPILAIEAKERNETEDPKAEQSPPPFESPPQPPLPPEPVLDVHPTANPPVADLLSLDDFGQGAVELEEKNALALAIVTDAKSQNSRQAPHPMPDSATGWELALVDGQTAKEGPLADSKLAGGLDKLILDSLYDDAISRRTSGHQSNTGYHIGHVAPNPFETLPPPSYLHQDPFSASISVAPPTHVQMAAMVQQQQAMVIQDSSNPFGNPFAAAAGGGIAAAAPPSYPAAAHNPYTGYL